MADTTHLALPLVASNQAQKHVPVNTSLRTLDGVVQLSIKDRNLTAPPGSPAEGDRYIPASGATGAWDDWDLNVAIVMDGQWVKLVPQKGWLCWVEDEEILLIYKGAPDYWEEYTPELPTIPEIFNIILASSSGLTTGVKGDIVIPFAGAITKVQLLANTTGSIVIDIWKDTYANYPPVVGDSITASAKPTLSAASKSEDSTLTGWTTAVNAGDILRFNVDSVSGLDRVDIALFVDRS